ncbi:MAG TPA: hypothetical protein VF185_00365 [Patescibacteria group bacterium]
MADNISEVAKEEWHMPKTTFDDELNLEPHDEELAAKRKNGVTPVQLFIGLFARMEEAKYRGADDDLKKLKNKFPHVVEQVKEKAEKRGEPLLPENKVERFEKKAQSFGLTFNPPEVEIPTKE